MTLLDNADPKRQKLAEKTGASHAQNYFAGYLFWVLLAGCAGLSGYPQDTSALSISAPGGGTNAFNPYMQSELPNLREQQERGRQMLGHLGGKVQSIEEEARHRKIGGMNFIQWSLGTRKRRMKSLLCSILPNLPAKTCGKPLFPQSKSLSPKQCKIVVFGKSSEKITVQT